MRITCPRLGQQVACGKLARAGLLTPLAPGAEARQFTDILPGQGRIRAAAELGINLLQKQVFALGRVFLALVERVHRADVQAFAALRTAAFHFSTPCRD